MEQCRMAMKEYGYKSKVLARTNGPGAAPGDLQRFFHDHHKEILWWFDSVRERGRARGASTIAENIEITNRIVFIIPGDCVSKYQTAIEMQLAFKVCEIYKISNISWQHENAYDVKETDFVVFEAFTGQAFETVAKMNNVRIVGPWCLLTCLYEGRQIPNYPWPIYNISMLGCIITFSSLSEEEEKKMQEKIQYMAGCVSASLNENCTHLVTDSVKSEKYVKAAEKGLNLMLSSWVDGVWKRSAKANVHCDEPEFEKLRCPPFHKLVISSAGLSNLRRNELKAMVTGNGGVYTDDIGMQTDIVVCNV